MRPGPIARMYRRHLASTRASSVVFWFGVFTIRLAIDSSKPRDRRNTYLKYHLEKLSAMFPRKHTQRAASVISESARPFAKIVIGSVRTHSHDATRLRGRSSGLTERMPVGSANQSITRGVTPEHLRIKRAHFPNTPIFPHDHQPAPGSALLTSMYGAHQSRRNGELPRVRLGTAAEKTGSRKKSNFLHSDRSSANN